MSGATSTMPAMQPLSSAAPSYARRPWQLRAAINQAVCVVVALAIWLVGGRSSLWVCYGYSFLIGNCCWLLIDGGRLVAGRWRAKRVGTSPHWPGWPAMALVISVGGLLGYLIGSSLGNAAFGLHMPSLLHDRGAVAMTLLAGLVATYFYWMRESLAARRAEVEAARRQAAETQLRLLQSQLEPHMLFNTLANLRVLITLDPPRAQEMLDRLIGFLRSTLGASRVAAHPLQAEFDRTADYLALMAVRMGPRLATKLDLPPELAALPVPPLLLQPLVENAIQHGLEPQVAGGRIEVRARRDGDALLLTVRDTGRGLLDAGTTPEAGHGFGTQQVRERLATLHGDAASLVLSPAPDAEGGTLATLRLPLPLPASTPTARGAPP